MLMLAARRSLVEYGRRLVRDGLVVGSAGNLGARDGRLIAVTPAGLRCDDLAPADICVVDDAGRLVDGTHAPTSELPLHLGVFAATGCGAVVHTHSPCATALATAGRELPPIHYSAADLGGTVRVAPYELFGTEALARAAVEALRGRTAVLLERHGTLTIGETLAEAYDRAVCLEWLAELYLRTSAIARVLPLTAGEVARVRELLAHRASVAAAGARGSRPRGVELAEGLLR